MRIKRGTWILRMYTRAVSSRLGNCVLKIGRMIPNIITTDPTQGALGGEKMKFMTVKWPPTAQGRCACLLFGYYRYISFLLGFSYIFISHSVALKSLLCYDRLYFESLF